MPYWLKKQLRQAFLQKNRYQILVLNDCWYFYKKLMKENEVNNENCQ